MSAKAKIRAKASGDLVKVKILMSHPMETGMRKDKSGKVIPADYIKSLQFEAGGKQLMDAGFNPTVSKNPYFAFNFKGSNKGDEIKLTWTDNHGASTTQTAKVK